MKLAGMTVGAVGAVWGILNLGMAWALQAPDFEVRFEEKGAKLQIQATPPAGHHFNLQAPMSLKIRDAASAKRAQVSEPARVVYEVPKGSLKPGDSVSLTAYLCDDRQTFCEKHVVTQAWKAASTTAVPQTSAQSSDARPVAHAAKKRPASDKNGFFLNEPTEALEQAKKTGNPLLIDFFGIWCPPCNELDEEVFSSPEFRQEGSRFVRLKLDVDSPVSWELKSKFKVGGYPTLIFATPDGDEIRRVVGFRPKALFVREMKQAYESREQPFSALLKKADSGDRSARDQVGAMALDRHDFALAAKYLEGTEKLKELLYEAKIGALESASKGSETPSPELVRLLEESIREFPASPDALDRRSKLADLYQTQKQSEKAKTVREDLIRASEALIQHPERLEGLDLTVADLWTQIAETREQLGNEAGAKDAWKAAAQEYRRHIRPGQADHERGYNLELAHCLWKSGQWDQARAIYRKLETRYPKEFTFYFGDARMHFAQKKWKDAQALARKAYQYSYGDNRLRVAQLLAESLEKTGDRSEALKVIEATISQAEVPSDSGIRTHFYVQKLKDLREKLSSPVQTKS